MAFSRVLDEKVFPGCQKTPFKEDMGVIKIGVARNTLAKDWGRVLSAGGEGLGGDLDQGG